MEDLQMSKSVYVESKEMKSGLMFQQHGIRMWLKALYLRLPDLNAIDLFFNEKTINKSNSINKKQIIDVCSDLGMSLSFYSAISTIKSQGSENLSNLIIIAWYYCTYFAARAMILAKDADFTHKTHAKVSNYWLDIIVKRNLIPAPFDLYVDSLEKNDVQTYLTQDESYDSRFNSLPSNINEAKAALLNHLNGTIKRRREQKEKEILKENKIPNFRKKINRELRDNKLKQKSCGFLHQAYRYRVKTNYLEYLHLGEHYSGFESDLIEYSEKTLRIFCYIAIVFCCKSLRSSKDDCSLIDLVNEFPDFIGYIDIKSLEKLL